MDCSSMSSSSGSGAFWESWRGVVDFFVAFGLAAVLGLLAALEPEPLRAFAGVPALEPSFGGVLLTAGEDMVVFVRDWMVGFEMGSCVVDMKNQNPVG
jgi:hypothetical protein